jgi:limonene 1,2-monooxygenase
MPDISFGVFIAPYHSIREEPFLMFERDLELIEWCDRMGFDEAWVGEHHSGGWESIGDPLLMLAAAGQRTSRIKLGSGVVSLPYHHPFVLADRFTQLDHMTRGRAMLGVGPGALVSDALMLGIDPVTQRPRMDEALGVILQLLAGETVSYEADWFTLAEAQLQLLPYAGSLPVAVASTTSPSGMACAGKYGVGVLSLGAGLVGAKKDMAAQWAIGGEQASKHGQVLRRSEWRLVIRAHLAETREQAIADVREGREHERVDYFAAIGGLRSDTTLEEEIAEDTAIVGTPDDMIAALHRLTDATGGFGTFLVMAHDWANREKTLKSFELLGRYVMPEFNGRLSALQRSYDSLRAKKRQFARPVMTALSRAYTDAGYEVPEDLAQQASQGRRNVTSPLG